VLSCENLTGYESKQYKWEAWRILKAISRAKNLGLRRTEIPGGNKSTLPQFEYVASRAAQMRHKAQLPPDTVEALRFANPEIFARKSGAHSRSACF
jgi:hypothetical protein